MKYNTRRVVYMMLLDDIIDEKIKNISTLENTFFWKEKEKIIVKRM